MATTTTTTQSTSLGSGRFPIEETAPPVVNNNNNKTLNDDGVDGDVAWAALTAPATLVAHALQDKVPKNHKKLQEGLPVSKVTSYGEIKPRVLTISKDLFALFVTHDRLKEKALSTAAKKFALPMFSRKGIANLLQGKHSSASLRDLYVRYIDVADIDYIQVGVVGSSKLELARSNRLKGQDSYVDKKCDEIVTVGHHGTQTLDVLVANAADRQALVDTLKQMRATYQQASQLVSNDALLLRYIWYDVDVNRDGQIGQTEFGKLLQRINFYVQNPNKVYQQFVAKHAGGKKCLTYHQTMTLLQQLKDSVDTSGKAKEKHASMANILWNQFFDPKSDVVDAETFLSQFLIKAQCEKYASLSQVEQMFEKLAGVELNHNYGEPGSYDKKRQLTRARFALYLHHSMNHAYDPASLIQNERKGLDKPLSRYRLNTSHNTYLTGDQLKSRSSVQMYADALRRGCKCLELDCWDGDKNANGTPLPVIFHGHTVTSKILFQDVIAVVNNYLRDHSDTYPIILSLENHCSHPYQQEMAKCMEQTFGDLLYIPPEQGDHQDLPSPEDLRGKIVIKGKRPPEADEATSERPEGGEEGATAASEGEAAATAKDKPLPKIVPELARLTLFHGTKFKEFETSILAPRSHMHSIGETKITKILSKSSANTTLWRLYNIHHMTRTYPAGARVDSSNYNPLVAWWVGCQMVALNFQTSDPCLLLNDGLFRQEGGCGYLLKPPSLLGTAMLGTFDDLDASLHKFEEIVSGEEGRSKLIELASEEKREQVHEKLVGKEQDLKSSATENHVTIKIRILSGSCLPKPMGKKTGEHIDPYVTVTMHDVQRAGSGAKAQHVTTSHSTSTVSDNGFCPVWNETEAKETFVVHSTEIAMVHFSLRESDYDFDDLVADACIPVSCLRSGYRSILLYNHSNLRTGPFSVATLLVHIEYSAKSSA